MIRESSFSEHLSSKHKSEDCKGGECVHVNDDDDDTKSDCYSCSQGTCT